jgi:hypothetical protein
MAPGINVNPALVMALKVQTAWRNHAEHTLQRSKRDARLIGLGESWALPANDILFVDRGQAIGVGRHRFAQGAAPLRRRENIGITGNRRSRHGGDSGAKSASKEATSMVIYAVARDGRNEFATQEGFWCGP